MEAFAAVRARIRPCVAVDQQMRGQRAGALEGLAALLALKAEAGEDTKRGGKY